VLISWRSGMSDRLPVPIIVDRALPAMSRRFAATDYGHGYGAARALSLPEVLVVCAVILFLLALLFPGLSATRERLRRLICANNLRQWGAALQYYRDDHNDYLPTEGSYLDLDKPYAWFNVLPPYLGAPAYRDVDGVGDAIKEFPALHIWICPSKNLTNAYKSGSGKNQFHYGMSQVLDGMSKVRRGLALSTTVWQWR